MANKIKRQYKINIAVEFENWDKDVIITDELLKDKVEKFVKGVFPMNQMTLGNNSGDLNIQFKQLK